MKGLHTRLVFFRWFFSFFSLDGNCISTGE